MIVDSAVVLAGVMIGVMPMGVVRRRLRMGSLAVVYSEFEKERGKSLIGKKFKEQRVYCPR
jgi:hypothetical protein